MKKLILSFYMLMFYIQAFAQAPQGINYQAVARDGSGVPLSNQNVSVKFSILNLTATGTTIYEESHSATTNNFGLFSIKIGGGTPTIGTFNTIDWGNGSKFLKVDINNLVQGTTQMLSVPYALYAERAGKHYVGELYGGGIVVYVDGTGQHGLILSLEDLGTSSFSNITTVSASTTTWDGKQNTLNFINQPGHTSSAAQICANYNAGGFNDWYLPSMLEFNKLTSVAYEVTSVLESDGNTNTYSFIDNKFYWTSSEVISSGSQNVYNYNFINSSSNNLNQFSALQKSSGTSNIRAMRKF